MIKKMLWVGIVVVSLSGCGSDCTEDVLKAKLQELTTEIQGLATSGDMGKLMEFTQKAQKISLAMQGDEGDLQAACDAVDELMNEL